MRVLFLKSTCLSCNYSFERPTLGDMAYGEFIALSSDMKNYLYLNTFTNKYWNDIETRVEKYIIHINPDHFHRIVSKCMDKINNLDISIFEKVKCPNCFSKNITENYEDSKYNFKEISDVTFFEYDKLSSKEKDDLIYNIIKEKT